MTPLQTTIHPCRGNPLAAKITVWVRSVLFLVLFLSIVADAKAAIINAANCSLSAVQTAVNSAANGDTVSVPAGIAYWTNSLNISTDIQLIGAGMGQTIIVDEVPRINGHATGIYWTTIPSGLPRLTGFTFQGGVTNNSGTFDGIITLNGHCSSMRVDHCGFMNLNSTAIYIENAVFGVIDHCQIYSTNFHNGIVVENGQIGGDFGGAIGYGDVSWATPVQWGTVNDFLYIEDCQFWWPNNPLSFVDDFAQGSRVVFRYNMVTNCVFQNHGTESSGRFRGGRAFEIYGNNFVNNAPGAPSSVAFYFRSGSGVIFSNIVSGFSSFWTLVNFRAVDAFDTWGGASGVNLWDSNNPAMLIGGTHTGTNSSFFLEDDSANWTPGQWVGGYELENASRGGTNEGTFALIASNTATRIYYIGSVYTGPMLWTNGQSYKIFQCYHQLDQVGSGSGDLVSDSSFGNGHAINTTTGQPAWPHEVSEPVYQWANTFNGVANYSVGQDIGYVPPGNGNYNIIQMGRDYFNNTPKPGYTPLIYPHPLTTLTNGLPNVAAPTNLRAY